MTSVCGAGKLDLVRSIGADAIRCLAQGHPAGKVVVTVAAAS